MIFNALHLTMILLWVLVYIFFATGTYKKDYTLAIILPSVAIGITLIWFGYLDIGLLVVFFSLVISLVIAMIRNETDSVFKNRNNIFT